MFQRVPNRRGSEQNGIRIVLSEASLMKLLSYLLALLAGSSGLAWLQNQGAAPPDPSSSQSTQQDPSGQ